MYPPHWTAITYASLVARSIACAWETLYRRRGPDTSERSLSADSLRDRFDLDFHCPPPPPYCGSGTSRKVVALDAGDASVCAALYRAAISCAGLLFLALAPIDPLVLSNVREGRTKPDMDQVLSTSLS